MQPLTLDALTATADVLVLCCPLTPETQGMITAARLNAMKPSVIEIEAFAAAARAVRPDILILYHGGPIAMPENAAFIWQNAATCHGFYGASSMERLPVEIAIAAQTSAFKALKVEP